MSSKLLLWVGGVCDLGTDLLRRFYTDIEAADQTCCPGSE